jgi:hypothetical protein
VLGAADGLLLEQGALDPAALPPPAAVPVAKRDGPDVPALLAELGYDARLQREQSLLEQVAPAGVPVEYRVLLSGSDRQGAVAWIDAPDAKAAFKDLKQKLLQTFSAGLKDLVDETTQKEGQPVVNRLSFRDPAVSPEQFVFLRIRERLYEVHIAPGQEAALAPLLEALPAR